MSHSFLWKQGKKAGRFLTPTSSSFSSSVQRVLTGVTGKLQPNSADLGREAGSNLNRSPLASQSQG